MAVAMRARAKASGIWGPVPGRLQDFPEPNRLPSCGQEAPKMKVTPLQGGHQVTHDVQGPAGVIRVLREGSQKRVQKPRGGGKLFIGADGANMSNQPSVPQL